MARTSTGDTYPTVGANVDRAGSTAWTNPGNVVSDNTTDATVVVPSDYLVTSGYGFAVPANSYITGVTVRVEASETGSGSSNYIPQLHSDTTPTLIGSAKTAVTVSGTTKVISTNGGSTDRWGATLTATTVNASGFGVSIWSTDTTNTLAIDFVTINVAYIEPLNATTAQTFSLTGNAATLRRGYTLACAAGSFTLTGNDTTFKRDARLDATPQQTFTLAGQAAGLLRGEVLDATPAQTFALTGIDVALTYTQGSTYTLDATTAQAFTLTGNAAGLNRGYTLSCAAAAFTLAGVAAGLTAQRKLRADNWSLVELFSEDFTGAAGPLPSEWTNQGDADVVLDGSGHAKTGSASRAFAWVNTPTINTRNQYAEATLTDTGAANGCGITVRMQTGEPVGTEKGYQLQAFGTSNIYRLFELNSSSTLQILEQVAIAPVDGDRVRLEIYGAVVGINIVAYVNGREVMRSSDPSWADGAPGIFANSTSALVDDFVCGDLKRGYTLTGNAVAFLRAYVLAADPATYTLTGNATGLTAQRTLVADPASYTVGSFATGLNTGRSLTCATGVFTLDGIAVDLLHGARLDAAPAQSFTVAGIDATLDYSAGATLACAAGAFTVTGNAAGLVRDARLDAAPAQAFTVTGNAAALTYAGVAPVAPSVVGSGKIRRRNANPRFHANEVDRWGSRPATKKPAPLRQVRLQCDAARFTVARSHARLRRGALLRSGNAAHYVVASRKTAQMRVRASDAAIQQASVRLLFDLTA